MKSSAPLRFSGLDRTFWVVLLALASARPAFAYTDPGSGMLIWQMLLAAFAGGAFYFRRFTTWIKKRRGPRE